MRRVDPSLVRRVQIGTVALGTFAAFETGLWTALLVPWAVALLLERVRALDPPGPVTKTKEVERSGLPEREVLSYLTMSNTLREMEKEEREEARREAERRGRQGR